MRAASVRRLRQGWRNSQDGSTRMAIGRRLRSLVWEASPQSCLSVLITQETWERAERKPWCCWCPNFDLHSLLPCCVWLSSPHSRHGELSFASWRETFQRTCGHIFKLLQLVLPWSIQTAPFHILLFWLFGSGNDREVSMFQEMFTVAVETGVD